MKRSNVKSMRNLRALPIDRRIRMGLIVALLLAMAVVGGVFIYPAMSYVPHTYKVIDGYRTVGLVQLTTDAIITPNELYNGTPLLVGYNQFRAPILNLSLVSWATLKPNFLFSQSTLYNSSFYFTNLVNTLYVGIGRGNTTLSGNYTVYLNGSGYYVKNLFSGKGPILVPINVSAVLNLSNEINNQLGISPPVQVDIRGSVSVGNQTIHPTAEVLLDGSLLRLNLVNGTLYGEVRTPIYQYLLSNQQNRYFASMVKDVELNLSQILGQYDHVDYTVFIVTPVYERLIQQGEVNSSNVLINLNMTSVNAIANVLNEETGTYYFPPTVRVDLKFDGPSPSLYPTVYLNYSNGLIGVSILNNSVQEPIYAVISTHKPDSTPAIVAELAMAGGLGFMFLGTRSTMVEARNRTRKLMSKYRKLLVKTNDVPNFQRVVEVKTVEELAKYSMMTGKPMLVSEGEGEVRIWVHEDGVVYMWREGNSIGNGKT